MTRSFYLDAAVPIHAVGGPSPFKDASRRFMSMVTSGEVVAHASVETVQEFAHHRLRVAERSVVVAQAETLASIVVLHDFDRTVLVESLRLLGTTAIRGRDAVHAATALTYGVGVVVSPDGAFDGLPGLTRVDPSEF